MKQLVSWDGELTTDETNEIVFRLCEVLLQRIKTTSVRCDLERIIAQSDYRGLVGYDFRYTPDLPELDVITVRQILAFFQKRQDLDLGIDRRAAALNKFLDSEVCCRVTNEAFKSWGLGRFQFDPSVDGVFHTAMRKISTILGPCPAYDDLRFRFGPGASTGIPKKNANSLTKLRSSFTCSEDLAPYAKNVLEQCPGWVFDSSVDTESRTVTVFIENGKLSFVPKNAKTDRTICTEPLLNTFVQLGIGDYMAGRLKRSGQDISDQSRNQQLARAGSIVGDIATLDLSSASDTISYELVRHLLPFDWFQLLETARTSHIETPVGVMKLEKFSSMGNGFTFPLETLIFLSLARACGTHLDFTPEEFDSISVYGDDITFPVRGVPLLLKVLRGSGFIVNNDKSYLDGPFRESCGADYYKGISVRPVYLRDRLSGQSLFLLHNFFVRELDDELPSILAACLHRNVRIYGPDGYGDGHLIGSVPKTPHRRKDGWGGYTFETFAYTSRCMKTYLQPGDFSFPLYSIYLSRGNGELPRTRYTKDGGVLLPLPGTRGYRRIKIYTLNG